jgi:predicted alpha/beta hydrolase
VKTADVDISAEGAQSLKGTVYVPDAPRAWLLINSAMGVRRSFYRHLAAHLAVQGIGVLTYDYRGIGDSVLADADVRLEDWGRGDFPAAIGWLRAIYAPRRLVVLGHSVGGQLLGITPAIREVDALVGVACQAGHWRHWSGLERAKVFTFWYAAIPLMTARGGTFAASMLGLGQDLPAGVARQWAEWGRDREYIRSRTVGPQPQFYDDIRCRLRTYLVEQDNLAPERAVRAWHDWFPNADREFVNLGSHTSAGRRIGHFGFFDPGIGAGEWPALTAFVRG